MREKKELKNKFHKAMLSIYERAASECNYPAIRFLNLVVDEGGVRAAKSLLHADGLSDGYTALWECGRLDLTMEALIVEDPAWRELFTEEEISIARKRLSKCEYNPKESI